MASELFKIPEIGLKVLIFGFSKNRGYTSPMEDLPQFQLSFIHPCEAGCGWHNHLNWEIILYLDGQGEFGRTESDNIPFKQNSVALIPPGVDHRQRNHITSTDCCLLFDLPIPHRLNDISHCSLIYDGISDETVSIIHNLGLATPTDNATELLRRNLLLAVALLDIGHHIDASLPAPDIAAIDPTLADVEQAKAFMHRHFQTIQTMAEVAEYVQISEDYLRHRFKDTYGQSLKSYLNKLRMDHAKQLLYHSPLPQKVIAQQCGFSNIRYFNTRFRHYCGMSPGEFRTRRRQDGPDAPNAYKRWDHT